MVPELSDFETATMATTGARIHVRTAGEGPGLLLLHGYPQTGAMWRHVAPALTETFTVVVPDLRGYGASEKPAGGAPGELYAKRVMAGDQVEVMATLGFDRFAVVGHDRGARVTHRMALDHPDRVTRAAVLDIIPTLEVFRTADERLARAYYHWFFLSQPFDLPERLIGAAPDFYLRWCLEHWCVDPAAAFDAASRAEYAAAFCDPETVHATCEDYRAGAGIDLEHDEADSGRKVTCPLLVLWGERSIVGTQYDPLTSWGAKANDVRGRSVPGAHFCAEEAPAETLAALREFLAT